MFQPSFEPEIVFQPPSEPENQLHQTDAEPSVDVPPDSNVNVSEIFEQSVPEEKENETPTVPVAENMENAPNR